MKNMEVLAIAESSSEIPKIAKDMAKAVENVEKKTELAQANLVIQVGPVQVQQPQESQGEKQQIGFKTDFNKEPDLPETPEVTAKE